MEESQSWIKRKISNFRADLKIWLNPGSYGKIRGIGLYLNRQFLLDAGGDIKLIETSEKGTVFVLKLPAYDKNILKKEQFKCYHGKVAITATLVMVLNPSVYAADKGSGICTANTYYIGVNITPTVTAQLQYKETEYEFMRSTAGTRAYAEPRVDKETMLTIKYLF